MLQELEDEEVRHIKYFEDAIKRVSLSDIDGRIILATQLPDIFKSMITKAHTVAYQPPYNMYIMKDHIQINIDLPDIQQEDTGDGMETVVEPDLSGGKTKIVLVTDDE